MVTSKEVLKIVRKKKEGEIITYDDFVGLENLNGVVVALSKLYKAGLLEKLGKGLFFKPKKSRFGVIKPSEGEIMKALLKKNKVGFISGVSAQNKLGLTTQIPNELLILGRLEKHKRIIGNLTIKYRKSDIFFENKNIEQLQVMDVLKNLKKIPDAEINNSFASIKKRIFGYSDEETREIFLLAKKSPPRVRALIGALLELREYRDWSNDLRKTLNPLSVYKLNLREDILPNKQSWNIR